ncbi:MAG: hypothetical protein P4M12_07375 [Gammaproteobacteria bacterium]|nr:hypothetical protein [Gammaproteobacteria bacterium]
MLVMLPYEIKSKQSGIVLALVLVFIFIFAVLSVWALNLCLLANKLSHNQFHKLSISMAAEEVLKNAEAHLNKSDTISCNIPMTTTQELLHHSLTWWQSSVSCAGNFQHFQYYYVIEFLGYDPCALVGQSSASYFRVTVLATTQKKLGARVFLQSTFVKPNKIALVCAGNKYSISAGRQTWRELN